MTHPLPDDQCPRNHAGRPLNSGKPVRPDVVFGKVAQRFIVRVAVPVHRENKVLYVLDMSFGPERLTHLSVANSPRFLVAAS